MLASNNYPLVTIGVLSYNNLSADKGDDRLIRGALESLIFQDWPNIQILIQDDCSNDGTQDICKEYALNNPHVFFEQNSINVGVLENIKKVVNKAQGSYFLWACLDDYYSLSYISACVKNLKLNSLQIVAQSYVRVLYPNKEETFHHRSINALNFSVEKDFNFLLKSNTIIHGLIKTAYAKIVFNIDVFLYFELSIIVFFILSGGVSIVEETLFTYNAKKPFSQNYPTNTFVKKRDNQLFRLWYSFKILCCFIKLRFKKIIMIDFLSLIILWFKLFFIYYFVKFFINAFKQSTFDFLQKRIPFFIILYRKVKKLYFSLVGS